jgi:hypothetical protein
MKMAGFAVGVPIPNPNKSRQGFETRSRFFREQPFLIPDASFL